MVKRQSNFIAQFHLNWHIRQNWGGWGIIKLSRSWQVPPEYLIISPIWPLLSLQTKLPYFHTETISVLSGFTATPNSNQTFTLHFCRQTLSQCTRRTAWIITSWNLAWLFWNEANKGGSDSAFDSFLCREDRACQADGLWRGSNRLGLSCSHKEKVSEEFRRGSVGD